MTPTRKGGGSSSSLRTLAPAKDLLGQVTEKVKLLGLVEDQTQNLLSRKDFKSG
jgi:hypothetical protein